MADCGVSIVLIWAPESRLALNASPLDQSLTSQRASWKAAFEAQSVASFRVQACGYVDSRKALRVGEYSDVCRGGLEQQFLKRADARVANCVTNTAESLKKNGEVFTSPVRSAFYCETLLLLFIELYAISKVYIFKREHDHAGGGCWGRTDYHDFADRPSRIIRNVDSRSLPALGEHVRLDVRLTPLGIFHR